MNVRAMTRKLVKPQRWKKLLNQRVVFVEFCKRLLSFGETLYI